MIVFSVISYISHDLSSILHHEEKDFSLSTINVFGQIMKNENKYIKSNLII